ncbi:hypothetical protein Q4S05_18770, partial [Morganella morganii]
QHSITHPVITAAYLKWQFSAELRSSSRKVISELQCGHNRLYERRYFYVPTPEQALNRSRQELIKHRRDRRIYAVNNFNAQA